MGLTCLNLWFLETNHHIDLSMIYLLFLTTQDSFQRVIIQQWLLTEAKGTNSTITKFLSVPKKTR